MAYGKVFKFQNNLGDLHWMHAVPIFGLRKHLFVACGGWGFGFDKG